MAESSSAWHSLLVCPRCGGGPLASPDLPILACAKCDQRYPVIGEGPLAAPWLFPDPGGVRAEWRARWNGFLQANARHRERLEEASRDKRPGPIGQSRIEHVLRARQEEADLVGELLAPLDLDAAGAPPGAAGGVLPSHQGLGTYGDHVFRDWAWETDENRCALDAARSVLDEPGEPLGRVLVLGAGAGRLAYDLHPQAELMLALDFNPLLALVAQRVLQGGSVELIEFPVAPLDVESTARRQVCRAPRPVADGFHLLLADGLNPPLAKASFDTVVTPWFIDVVPQGLRPLAALINGLLAPGGRWLNFGSLAFFHPDEADCHAQEEVAELAVQVGFEMRAERRVEIPYLQSPSSAHRRREISYVFAARKTAQTAEASRLRRLPRWLLDPSRPVPHDPAFAVALSSHLVQAQVLSVIDGKRSIQQIAEAVARQHGLSVEDGLAAVSRILTDLVESQPRGSLGRSGPTSG